MKNIALDRAEALTRDCMKLADCVSTAALVEFNEHRSMAAQCVARCTQALEAVRLLVSNGLNGDAKSVCRTIVEISIDLAYVGTDPATLVPRYMGYSAVRDYQMAAEITAFQPGVDPAIVAAAKVRHDEFLNQYPKSDRDWSGPGITLLERAKRSYGTDADRARQIQLKKLVYADMCGSSHSGYVTLRHTRVGKDREMIFGGGVEPDHGLLVLAIGVMLTVIKTVVESIGLEPSQPGLDGLENEWSRINAEMLPIQQMPRPDGVWS